MYAERIACVCSIGDSICAARSIARIGSFAASPEMTIAKTPGSGGSSERAHWSAASASCSAKPRATVCRSC